MKEVIKINEKTWRIESLKHLSKYEDLFDEIYPMHGTFPVHKDLIPKLIQGAQSIVDGNAQEYAQPVNMFGNEGVKSPIITTFPTLFYNGISAKIMMCSKATRPVRCLSLHEEKL